MAVCADMGVWVMYAGRLGALLLVLTYEVRVEESGHL